MAKKKLAVHVTRIVAHKKGKRYETVLLRHSYREDGKVKHLKIANLSRLDPDLINVIERAVKGETLVAAEEAFSVQRSLPHGHVAAVLGSIRTSGLEKIIAFRRSPQRDAVLAMIAQRIIDPSPKLATARVLHTDTAQNSLGECLGLDDVDEDDL